MNLLSIPSFLPPKLAETALMKCFTSPAASMTSSIQSNGKVIRIVLPALIGLHGLWKLLRSLSMSGDATNPFVKYLHDILKKYLNCGFMVRNEFHTYLPLQYYWIHSGRRVIVNYGSYGCVPKRVLEHQVNLQTESEVCPDLFNRITLLTKYEESRKIVAKYIGAREENLVFVDNITDGINASFRSLLSSLDDDDTILHTSLTFAMILKALDVHGRSDYRFKTLQFDINFPVISEDELVEAYEDFIKKHKHIKIAIFDHITCATAVVLPIARLAKICREHDIISIVDGAHAPGQVHLDLESYGADIYIGNLHKWYYCPKSCAIMYINPRLHNRMQPSLVSHNCYLGLQDRFRRQGTKNYSAHITAGYAVGEYMERIGGIDHLHSYIKPLLDWAVELYTRELKTEAVQIPESMKAPYMRVVYLPEVFTKVYGTTAGGSDQMIIDMIEKYNICMFVKPVNGRQATRISAQIFSTKSQYLHVVKVLKELAAELESPQK